MNINLSLNLEELMQLNSNVIDSKDDIQNLLKNISSEFENFAR